jgi:hypothetical protein
MNTDIEVTADEEYSLPCAEALLAGTLALMTGHVQACCDNHRALMARKITANLAQLAEHPLLSPAFRAMLWNLRTRWQLQLERDGALERPNESLWHASPAAMQ